MSRKEVPRAGLVKAALAGKVTNQEGARALRLSVRQFKRLKARFRREGAQGLVHRRRGQPSPRRVPAALRAQVVTLMTTTYAGYRAGGRQAMRVYKADWTREDAEKALAARLLRLEQPKPKSSGLTLAQVTERYLSAKSRKRSLANDQRIVKHLKSEFGEDTPLDQITAGRVSEYKARGLAAVRKIGKGETATEQSDLLIGLQPPDAALRLSRQSRTKHLASVVKVARESGLRRSEYST